MLVLAASEHESSFLIWFVFEEIILGLTKLFHLRLSSGRLDVTRMSRPRTLKFLFGGVKHVNYQGQQKHVYEQPVNRGPSSFN